MHVVSGLAEPDYANENTEEVMSILDENSDENTWIQLRAQPQLRVRSREIVFICIAYIPPRQSLRTSLPHPCRSVAELKDSHPNLAGETVGAYLVGNGLTPSFFNNLGQGGWG